MAIKHHPCAFSMGKLLFSLFLAQGPLVASLSLRSSVNFGSSCLSAPEGLWTATTAGPDGSKTLEIPAFGVYASPQNATALAAGPEPSAWLLQNAGKLSTSDGALCVTGSGSVEPCGYSRRALEAAATSASSGLLSGVSAWISQTGTYGAGGLPSSSAATTVVSGAVISGEWFDLNLVDPVRVTSYVYTLPEPTTRAWPRAHILAGWDGAKWITLGQSSSSPRSAYSGAAVANFSTASRSRVSRVRLIVTAVSQGATRTHIGALNVFTDTQKIWISAPTKSVQVSGTDPWASPTISTVTAQGTLPQSPSLASLVQIFSAGQASTALLSSLEGTGMWSPPAPPSGSFTISSVSFVVPEGASMVANATTQGNVAVFLENLNTGDAVLLGSTLSAGPYRATIATADPAAKLALLATRGAHAAYLSHPLLPSPGASAGPSSPPPSAASCSAPYLQLSSAAPPGQ